MNEGASGGQVISSHLYLNLLMHLVEKILLPQPLTLGGGITICLGYAIAACAARAEDGVKSLTVMLS
ncbi:MAG: hypothetical protein ACI8TF_000610 [Paracoccaceae bacterium]|jgi:hypothetical protein